MALSNWFSSPRQTDQGFKRLQPWRNRFNDPYYRFQTIEEVKLAAQMGISIDVNQAGVDDWLRLPGISIHQARSLVSLAQSGLQYHCLEDIAAALSLPIQRLKPLEPILQFCYYDASSHIQKPPASLNLASVEQLTQVPQIDLYLARAIVQQRSLGGPYRSMADFQQRLQLPAATMANLIHYLRL